MTALAPSALFRFAGPCSAGLLLVACGASDVQPEPPEPPGTRVCGDDLVSYEAPEALPSGIVAVHAGPCGACSNAADVTRYRETATTLKAIAEECATERLFNGDAKATACFESKAGFSAPCTDCWVVNMKCTADHCLRECWWARTTGAPNNLPDGSLNDCLACDERWCGKAFIECAGANRRRLGITSDIGRPAEQVWSGVDAGTP